MRPTLGSAIMLVSERSLKRIVFFLYVLLLLSSVPSDAVRTRSGHDTRQSSATSSEYSDVSTTDSSVASSRSGRGWLIWLWRLITRAPPPPIQIPPQPRRACEWTVDCVRVVSSIILRLCAFILRQAYIAVVDPTTLTDQFVPSFKERVEEFKSAEHAFLGLLVAWFVVNLLAWVVVRIAEPRRAVGGLLKAIRYFPTIDLLWTCATWLRSYMQPASDRNDRITALAAEVERLKNGGGGSSDVRDEGTSRRKLYFVPALLGTKKHAVRFLVDSGSNRNTLKRALCERAAFPISTVPGRETVTAFTGDPTRVLGKIRLPVSIGTVEKTLEFTVVEKAVAEIFPT